MPSVPYQIDDAKTDAVAVSGKWRTLFPTDVTPALLADLGGAHQGGSFAIAANASPRRAAFNVATTPNTTVEGDRYIDVEIYDVVPAGTSLTVGKVRTKIVEDDTAAPTNIYGPTTTADTGANRIDGGTTGYKMTGTIKNTQYLIHVAGYATDGVTGLGGYVFRGGASNGALSPTSVTGFYRASDGTLNLDNNAISLPIPDVTNGLPFVATVKPDGTVKLVVGSTTVFERKPFDAQPSSAPIRYASFKTNGAASPDVTITALSA